MPKKSDGEPLYLQGPPRRMVGRVALRGGAEAEHLAALPVKVSLAGGLAALSLPPRVRASDPMSALLKVRLPRNTSPGKYEGAAELGGRSIPVVADVHPFHRLRATPSAASLRVSPGKPVALTLDLANLGNVTVDIPARHTFCIFDSSGIDRSLFAALAEDPPQGERRIDRFMDELAAHHGGMVRLDVVDGAAPLPPGERRQMRLELRFSERMRPGRVYAGVWVIENMRFGIRAETAAETVARREIR